MFEPGTLVFICPWLRARPDAYSLSADEKEVELRNGVRPQKYDADKIAGVYRVAADLMPGPEGALAFIRKYGFPHKATASSYLVEEWNAFHAEITVAWNAARRGDWETLQSFYQGGVTMQLRLTPPSTPGWELVFIDDLERMGGETVPTWQLPSSDRPLVFMIAPSLRELAFMQIAADVTGLSSEVVLKRCEQCGDYFRAGPGQPKRADARFCSSRCRFASHNAGRSQGAKQ